MVEWLNSFMVLWLIIRSLGHFQSTNLNTRFLVPRNDKLTNLQINKPTNNQSPNQQINKSHISKSHYALCTKH
jgi:hypothetical protein